MLHVEACPTEVSWRLWRLSKRMFHVEVCPTEASWRLWRLSKRMLHVEVCPTEVSWSLWLLSKENASRGSMSHRGFVEAVAVVKETTGVFADKESRAGSLPTVEG